MLRIIRSIGLKGESCAVLKEISNLFLFFPTLGRKLVAFRKHSVRKWRNRGKEHFEHIPNVQLVDLRMKCSWHPAGDGVSRTESLWVDGRICSWHAEGLRFDPQCLQLRVSSRWCEKPLPWKAATSLRRQYWPSWTNSLVLYKTAWCVHVCACVKWWATIVTHDDVSSRRKV